MNFLKIIKEINTNNFTLEQKIKSIKNLIQYYYRLEKGILSKTIFQSENFDSSESDRLISTLDNRDYQIIKQILTENTKNILRNLELKKKIDFSLKKDFLQVGINTVYIHEPFKGLWTTGKATFYLPISKNSQNNLTIEIFSIIPTTVIIGQNEKILKKIPIKKIQTKKIELPLDITENNIFELFVDVEKRWRPNIITKKSNDIPMGVNIRSIMINQV